MANTSSRSSRVSPRLPSFVSIVRGLTRAWVAAAAVGHTSARPLGGRQPAPFGGNGLNEMLPSGADVLDRRVARGLNITDAPTAARAPTSMGPSPLSALAPDSAPSGLPSVSPENRPALGSAPNPAPNPAPAPAPALSAVPMPPTGVITPVSVSGTRFVDATGVEVFLLGPNLAANDACGVAPRSTDATVALYRAYAETMHLNMIAQDIILTPTMISDPTALEPFVDLARRVSVEMPGVTLFIRPLTDVALDGRSVPTTDYNRAMAYLAGRLHGLPCAISLGKELHRNHDDFANHTSNAAVNQEIQAALSASYTTLRAANPDILLLMPGLLDPTSGAQYSRSAAGYRQNFNYTNAAVAIDLYTTESTEAGQWAQVQAWALDHVQALPLIVTELAPYAEASLGVNMTEGVFNRTFAALANQGVPVGLWSGEFKCAPSMLASPWTPGSLLDLNLWGSLAVSWIRSYIG